MSASCGRMASGGLGRFRSPGSGRSPGTMSIDGWLKTFCINPQCVTTRSRGRIEAREAWRASSSPVADLISKGVGSPRSSQSGMQARYPAMPPSDSTKFG